jgi:hypothetical protein
MDAEMVRDTALNASGLLAAKLGGPSVKPYQPDGIWENVTILYSNTHTFARDTGENLYRRSLYTFWKRSVPPVAMEIFNAPSREICTIRRDRTDTPMQALATLDDPQFVEAAKYLGQRAIKLGGDNDEARIRWMGKRVVSRDFNASEIKIIKASLHDFEEYYQAKPNDAKGLLTSGESKVDPSINVSQLAAWTMVANELMNLDEALNK